MPLGKKFTFKAGKNDERTLTKSVSNPEVNEKGNKLSEDNSGRRAVKKKRRFSWLTRFFPKFVRRRKPADDSTSSASNFPVQKSVSCQFYTPPPKDFLEKVTNTSYEEDDDGIEKRPDGVPLKRYDSNASRDVVRSSSKRAVVGMNVALVNELKKSLMIDDKSRGNLEREEKPMYGNVADLRYNIASTRKKSKPTTRDNADYKDLENLYERTWSFETSNQTDGMAPDQNYSEPTLLKPPPLHRFPKPKPPINRKPSSRRNSKPQVIIRSKPADNVIPKSVRRSDAELEEVIQNLYDIPAPDIDETFPRSPPTPKRRTIFNSTDDISSENPSHTRDIAVETEILEVPSIPEGVTDKSVPSNEVGLPVRTDDSSIHNDKSENKLTVKEMIGIFNRVQAKTTDDLPRSDGQYLQGPFKRWRTLPIKYAWHSAETCPRNNPETPITSDSKGDICLERSFEIVNDFQDKSREETVPSLTTSDESPEEVPAEEALPANEILPDVESLLVDDLKEIFAPFVTTENAINQTTPPNTPEQEPSPDIDENEIKIDLDLYSVEDQSVSPTSYWIVDGLQKVPTTPDTSTVSIDMPLEHEPDKKMSNNESVRNTAVSHSELTLKESETDEKRAPEEPLQPSLEEDRGEIDNSTVSNRVCSKNDSKKAPVKPARKKPKSSSWKPQPPPKPKGFTRQGAVRYKSFLSTEERTENTEFKNDKDENDSNTPSTFPEGNESIKNRRSQSII